MYKHINKLTFICTYKKNMENGNKLLSMFNVNKIRSTRLNHSEDDTGIFQKQKLFISSQKSIAYEKCELLSVDVFHSIFFLRIN